MTSIEVSSIDELPPAAVEQSFAQLAQLMQEAFPNVDTRRGVIGDLVLQTDAIFDTARQLSWSRLRRSMSLLTISEDPSLADDDVVDGVLANWGVTRGESLAATGEVTIVLNRNVAMTIAAGTVFVANNLRFVTQQSFAARTSTANLLSSSDRLLTQTAADRWAFTITVVAEEPGVAGLLSKDTMMVPLTATTAFVQAYAANDFTGAADALTNEQMLERQQLGIAARAYSNRVTTESLVRNTPEFTGVTGMSVIGAGDAEMHRDRHSLIPIGYGGCTDIYVRTRVLPVTVTMPRTATLVTTLGGSGVWQFAIERDDFPGFYEVPYVQQADGNPAAKRYSILSDVRDIDITGNGYVPDIVTAEEACYSAYQAAVIQFVDADTPVTGLVAGESTREYLAAVVGMPQVGEIQAFIGQRDIRNPAGDHMVRGAVPCFMQINLTVEQHGTAVDVAAVQTAVASYVNATAFVASLYSTGIATVVRSVIEAADNVRGIDMLGRIRGTDGTSRAIRSRDVLTIPESPASGISPRTVCFLLDPADVAVTIV